MYTEDVRVNLRTEMLYVKADGLRYGITRETILFEFDLAARKLVKQVRVQPNDLPAQCSQ